MKDKLLINSDITFQQSKTFRWPHIRCNFAGFFHYLLITGPTLLNFTQKVCFDIVTMLAINFEPQTRCLGPNWSLETRKCGKTDILPYLLSMNILDFNDPTEKFFLNHPKKSHWNIELNNLVGGFFPGHPLKMFPYL